MPKIDLLLARGGVRALTAQPCRTQPRTVDWGHTSSECVSDVKSQDRWIASHTLACSGFLSHCEKRRYCMAVRQAQARLVQQHTHWPALVESVCDSDCIYPFLPWSRSPSRMRPSYQPQKQRHCKRSDRAMPSHHEHSLRESSTCKGSASLCRRLTAPRRVYWLA